MGDADRELGKGLPQCLLVVRAVLPCGLEYLVRVKGQAPIQQVLRVGEGFGRRQFEIIRDTRNALAALRKWPTKGVAGTGASGPTGFVAITLSHGPIMRATQAGMNSLADQTRWMDATDQSALVASGEVSPSELLEAAIERVERIDPVLNAVVIRWFDHARETAANADLPDGPFRGVPFLIKDLFATYAGQWISNGNVAFKEAHVIADADTTLVSRHRAAGLVIAGRTNSPELGSVPTTEPIAWGPTRNPTRTPGGSSGGAAAAVASGMVPIAHASDGGGSIRIPHLVAASSDSSRAKVASRSAHSATRADWRSRTASAALSVTRRHCSTRRAARAPATP
jgi:Amidase